MKHGALIVIAFTAGLTACQAEKEKAELLTASTFVAIEPTNGGSWTAVETVESAHAYPNDENRQWVVRGSAEATEMRVVFERFELESGYDFLLIGDGAGSQVTSHTGDKNSHEEVVQGNVVQLVLRTDYSITGWGFRAVVYEAKPCRCTPVSAPVCGTDGTDYDNACEAECAGTAVAHRGACGASQWANVPRSISSPHNYANNYDNTWTVSEGGSNHIRLHFSRIDVERGYDFLEVRDGSQAIVARYTGSETNVTTPVIKGDTAYVRLVTDYSIQKWGFEMDYFEVLGGCISDADCAVGNRCVQPQCIRAPCFKMCEPNGTQGYQVVTISELDNNFNAYLGASVQVTAEPHISPAACTRRGCSAANPCCNVCTAAMQIGATNIQLRSADGTPYGCSGNECNWESTCQPFPSANAGRFELRGTFTIDSFGDRRLALDSYNAADCAPTGCNSEVCNNGQAVVSTCIALPEYACYSQTNCEPQRGGHCGWTQTPAFQACMAAARTETYNSSDTPLSIPDNNPAGISSDITVLGAGLVSNVRVSFDITHTYRGDLTVRLLTPSGEAVVLHDGTGGSQQNLIIGARALPQLSGLTKSGAWTLEVVDGAARDIGTLDTWSLEFD